MATDPAIDVKDVLVSASIGTFGATSGWSITISRFVDQPDTMVAIFTTGGFDSNPKWLLDQPTVQVRIRGARDGYQAAYTKALAVKDALLGLSSQTVNDSRYVGCLMQGDINFIQYDDNSRPIFTENFALWREPDSGTYRTSF